MLYLSLMMYWIGFNYNLDDNNQMVELKLRPSPKLIDDAFVFIRRLANATQLITDSHKLIARYEKCFYQNENSALDLCDQNAVVSVN